MSHFEVFKIGLKSSLLIAGEFIAFLLFFCIACVLAILNLTLWLMVPWYLALAYNFFWLIPLGILAIYKEGKRKLESN